MIVCSCRAELEAAQTELLEVKQLYVEMCQQKDRLEADLHTQHDRQGQLIQVSLLIRADRCNVMSLAQNAIGVGS